ncbi:MAG: type II secretion system F family protein [Candidatus Aminicenantia bacterium]
MPYYLCKLSTEEGKIISTSYLAGSREEAKKYFENNGFCVLGVKKDWKQINLSLVRKIKDGDFIMFNQELVALLKAGYPIHRALETIIQRVKKINLKELLLKIREEVKDGKSLSEAFSHYGQPFSKIYPVALLAGEKSGSLETSISRFINYSKTISQTKKKIKSALTYPTLLIIFSLLLLGIIFNFVLPRFSSFYRDFEAELPALTRFLIVFSSFLERNIVYFLIGSFLIIIFYFRLKKTEKGILLLDNLKLKIPYASTFWIESTISLFCRTLSLLLAGGIPLVSSIEIARESVTNKYLGKRMEHLSESIKNGESLTNSLAKTEFFPPLSLDMIRVGETSAALPEMLAEVADFYDQKIETRISTLVSLIEPVVIIFMGLLIAGMLLSVYLPIFNVVRIAG